MRQVRLVQAEKSAGCHFSRGTGMFDHVKGAKPVRLGFLPTHRKGVFSTEAAAAEKVKVERRLNELGVDFVGIDGANEHGLLFSEDDVDAVVAAFRNGGVDAIFVCLCDFGTEVPVGRVCKALGLPVLLWGPRDEAPLPDIARDRDTQCGLFAMGKLLRRLRLPFTYITNCRPGDLLFSRGLDVFLRAANVVRCFRGARIGQIDTRPAPFTSTMCNESELLERWDVQILPTALSDVTDDALARVDSADTTAEVEAIRAKVRTDDVPDQGLRRVAALKLAMAEWIADNRLDAVAIQCWPTINRLMHVCPCFVDGELTDLGVPVACETDVNGALSAIALQAAAMREDPVFFADLTIRHPEDDNAELLWHCGPFPLSLADPSCEPRLVGHYMQEDADPAVGAWALKPGEVTLGRFDGDNGDYSFLLGHAQSCDGPPTAGNYLWVRVGNWPLWEERLVCGPYIHHIVGAYGKLAPAVAEGLKYLGITAELVEPDQSAVQAYMRGQAEL
jgi:L-fucose isomerase-like protein